MANSTDHQIIAEGIEITGNLTFSESLAQLPAALWYHRDLLVVQGQIVTAALACIYLGSFASLRRPPSASPPPKKKKGSKSGPDDDDDRDDQFVQGLVASDAIMFPILAGFTLVGLYYLIKWLEDPAIISKIMGIYFSVMSLASMGKFFADTLHFFTGLVFPDVWKAKDGTLWHFDVAKKCQYKVGDNAKRIHWEARNSPFPGQFWCPFRLSEQQNKLFWDLRHLYKEQWTVRIAVHGLIKEKFQVRLNDVIAVFLAIGASIFYQTTKSNFLSNVMGYAFSYAGIITLSPTTFPIGSAVLFGLFFYDIYMVFYTPYMVTVATKLDVPIKLVFEHKGRASMLGLGDIVVPGIFIGLCLRFDHFLYYYRQRKLVPTVLETQESSSDGVITTKDTQRLVQKPTYVSPQGQWGNRFWGSREATPAVKAAAFPKTYFLAAMIGYLLAMLTTLAMLIIFKHAQPALLYLVPGVVSAVWITGVVRGELHEVWLYTEDGSLDKEDVVVEVDGEGNVIKELEEEKEGQKDEEPTQTKNDQGQNTSSDDTSSDGKAASSKAKRAETSRTVFAFSIEAPPAPATEEYEQ